MMLEVRLLGQFDVRRDGESIAIPSRPAQSLLAYLVLNPGVAHRREKLAGLLSPDSTEENARSNLRHALWRIRKSLGTDPSTGHDYLLVDEIAIAFDAASVYWLDAAVVDKKVAADISPDDLIGVASAYGGDLLPGFYDEWVVLERERLQSVFEQKMALLLDRLVEARRWQDVLEWGERWIALGHVPEPAYRALMIAHAGRSDLSSAAAAYHRCVEALRNELGVEPSEQTRALYERLARGEPGVGAPAEAPFQIRYRLGAELGRGGMGVVYRAHDTLLDRDVAVKMLSATALGTEGRARLLREAQSAAKLNHVNIVSVYDAGETDGAPFIVMELVEGESLREHPPQRLDDVVSLARQICAALEHAHAQGITHRDLKPENIVITRGRRVKLMDFGLAYSVSAERLTVEGTLVGTPSYLAPEQILGQDIDARTDLYALGVMLYELTTGRLPFTGEDLMTVISQHLHAPVIPPSEHNAEIPPALNALIVRLMSKQADDRPASAAEVLRTLDELAGIGVEAEAPAPGEPPFMGLRYFDEADADLFFGRELLTAKLVGHLRDHHFLAVIVGASGSGKSSIVRAGLIPALKRGEPLADGTLPPEGCAYWPAHVITPTAHPLEALAISLTRDAESVAAIATLMDDLARDPRSLHLFVRRRRGPQGTQGTQETQETRGDQVGGHLLLVVDQFEELFTLCRDEAERKAFIDNLLTATVPSVPSVPSAQSAGETPTIVVLTLRADFYAHCAQYANLREALAKHQEYIGPMSAEELRRAIEEPARRGGWEFEPGLVDLFLREVGDEPGALPLLSHALLETWQRRRGRTMTLKGYAESGGVRGAIAKTAETVFNHQLTPEQQAIARSVFLRLTELGEGTQDTRRRAALNELIPNPQLQPSVELVLKILADARLITTSENTIEVAHEALIREWPTLRQWLDEDREGLRLHRHLTEAAQAWDELDRDPGEVYRGARLAQATEWAATHASELNALERAFLDASQAWAELEEAEREAQRQRELEAAQRLAEAERLRAEAEKQRAEGQARAAWQLRRRALYLTGAFVLALVMAGATLFFGEQARQAAITAQANERVAFSRELAAAAISNLDADPERSILLALQAVTETYSAGLPVPLQAEDALHQAVLTSRVQLVLRGHGDGQVVAVTFSPDGTRLATFSEDEITKVWDAITGRELLTLPGYFAAFSPDGTRLATVVADGAVKMWDAATGHELTLAGRVEAGIGVDFSPDGMHLATAPGKVAKVWDASTGQELLTLSGHTEFVGFAVFSPDGQRLVTASDDKTARVWDATTGEELLSLPHTDWVLYATFGPDGKRVATVSGGSAKVWDATTGEALFTLAGHTNVIYGVTFSPDGTRLATGSLDREVKVWDATNGQELFTLSGHTGAIYGLSFSPDGTRLATGSVDGTVRVWDVSPSREALTLPTPDGSSGRVVFSPDGARLAAGFGVEGVVKVWDVATGQTLLTLAGHTSPVAGVAFSPDGTHLATGAADGTVKLWDAATGQELLALSGHDSWVNSVAFSPDGTRLATSSDDYTARIWDATSGRELHKLSHTREVPAVAFSPDGTRLATGVLNGTAKVWDASTGKELLTLRGHSDTVWGVAFSLDGTRLATASQDGTAKVWDAATGQELLTLPGHTSTVVTVAFSPDGSRLATASRDGTAKIWDTATGQELLPLYGDGSGLNGIAFSPDGTRLATGGNQAVRVYLMWIEDLVALARTRVTRSLTTGECQQYLRLAQCPGGTAPATRMPTAATAPTTAAAQPPAAKGKVCQVAEGSVYDGFFNELAYTGVQDAAETFEWEDAVLESSTPTAFDRNTQEFLEANCDLIVVTTFGLADITRAAAETNPNQKFQVMDRPYDLALDNVWAEVYAVDQAAFLSGYVAASVTKTGKVGTFGGIGIPPVTDFMNGFALGVAYYNEKNGASIEVMGWDVKQQDGLFVGNFCCVAEGRQMAERLLDEGADIILPVAGPTVGSGAAEAAQAHGDAYLIGVDTNYAVSFPEYADIILTSIEKRLDVSVVLAVKAIVDGTFTGGTHVGTLENSGVGISPFHNLDALVSPEVKADLEQIKADIIAGKIKTK